MLMRLFILPTYQIQTNNNITITFVHVIQQYNGIVILLLAVIIVLLEIRPQKHPFWFVVKTAQH